MPAILELFGHVTQHQIVDLARHRNVILLALVHLGHLVLLDVGSKRDSRQELQVIAMGSAESILELGQESLGLVGPATLDKLEVAMDEDGPEKFLQLVLSTCSVRRARRTHSPGSAYLVVVEVSINELLQQAESLAVFLEAHFLSRLVLWSAIWAKVHILLAKDLFSSVVAPLEEVIRDLAEQIVSLCTTEIVVRSGAVCG
jgi:hypothetical protein